MCVLLGDRVCLGLCMLFNPWGSGRETDVRAGKLSSMLMCHHILISVPAAKSVYAQGSGRVCNYVLLCTHNSAFQWARPCELKSHFRQCPRCVCVCVCVHAWEWHSHIPAISQSLKQKLKGGVVNTVTLSAEQPVCIMSCGKQPRQTGDFQSHFGSGWPWCVRMRTHSLPPTISLPLILTSLCLSAFVLLSCAYTHTHTPTETHIFNLINLQGCSTPHSTTLARHVSLYLF